MTPRITVVIPTTGRASLAAAKASAAGADEIIVVPDSTGDFGYTPRTKGMLQATGTHIAFLDDDDVYLPGAIEIMRAAAADVPAIFKMDHPTHGILWRERKLEFGNVGTPMFLVPNVPDKLGVWAPHAPGLPEPGGDFTFISGCVERMGEPVWRDEIVCVVRPHERGPSVSVVTPWFNHLEYLPQYRFALDISRPDEVIIVDNGSDPAVPDAAIRFDENRGFSGACNAGLHAATSEAVLFLNNDIAPTRPNWLSQLRKHLEPGVLVGAQLRNDLHAAVDGIRMPYLDGWCVAGMRADLVELGGWDDTYDEPSYYGDNDLSLRARAAGMELREVKVGLRHLLNGTAKPDDPRVRAATLANRARYESLVRELMGVAA